MAVVTIIVVALVVFGLLGQVADPENYSENHDNSNNNSPPR